MNAFTHVKVFSATMVQQRDTLGEKVTDWLATHARANNPVEIVDKVVTQSSDQAFHCLSIVLFYRLAK